MPYPLVSNAYSTYGGGRSDLTARPYQVDTTLADIRGFGRPRASTQTAAMVAPAQEQAQERDPLAERLKLAALRRAEAEAADAEARLNAKQMAPQQRQLTGFGMTGSVDDIDKMNAYQREVYLPNNSSIVSVPGESRASLSKTPGQQQVVPQTPYSLYGGGAFDQARLGEALKRSNDEYTARQQLEALARSRSAPAQGITNRIGG
jgi:hypothetical protein